MKIDTGEISEWSIAGLKIRCGASHLGLNPDLGAIKEGLQLISQGIYLTCRKCRFLITLEAAFSVWNQAMPGYFVLHQ